MDRESPTEWITEKLYAGRQLTEREQEGVPLLAVTLGRFVDHLRDSHGIERLDDTSLEALQGFEFDLPANDDHHLRIVFLYFGRSDLLEHLDMVSADKYFRNKKLVVALKEMADLKEHIKSLRKVGVRMASDLLALGATPEGRAGLAAETGIPADALLKMVRCCDLCRMTGMAGKTLRRVMDMGYDTLPKWRAVEPEIIEADLADYLKQRGERANRMIPYGSYVRQARRLEDVITF
jgi:hypothetical protein